MFCGECGHQWAPDEIASARFCAECGAPREDQPPPATAIPAPVNTSAPPVVPHVGATTSGYGASSDAYSVAPTVKAVSFAPSPAPALPAVKCSKCLSPYPDSSAMFCGECGQPRATASVSSAALLDDGDLFGNASTTATYVPPANPAAPTYSASHSTWSSSPVPSPSPFGAPSVSVGYTPSASQGLSSYGALGKTSAPPVDNTPPASITMNTAASVNSVSSLLQNLSGV